jgi:hypothetical protein
MPGYFYTQVCGRGPHLSFLRGRKFACPAKSRVALSSTRYADLCGFRQIAPFDSVRGRPRKAERKRVPPLLFGREQAPFSAGRERVFVIISVRGTFPIAARPAMGQSWPFPRVDRSFQAPGARRWTMTTMSVARIAESLQRDFQTAAGQLRQTGRRLRTTSRHFFDAADIIDKWAATVNDVRPDLLITYHELLIGPADRERHAELLRQIAFKGTAKTASQYVCAYISDRTGGG